MGMTEPGKPGWDENSHLPLFLLICGAIYEEHAGPPVFPLHCFHLEGGESLKHPNPDKAGMFFCGYHPSQPRFKSFLSEQLSFITQIQKTQVEAATSYPKGAFSVHKEPPLSFANWDQSPAPRQKNRDNPVLCPSRCEFTTVWALLAQIYFNQF